MKVLLNNMEQISVRENKLLDDVLINVMKVEKVKFMVQDFILNNQIFAYLQLLIDLFH
jgi:uncharacterized protein YoxC